MAEEVKEFDERFWKEVRSLDGFLRSAGKKSAFRSNHFDEYLERLTRIARDSGEHGIREEGALLRGEGYRILGSQEGMQKIFEYASKKDLVRDNIELRLFLLHVDQLPRL